MLEPGDVRSVRLTLWPAGDLSASLRVPGGYPVETDLRIRLARAPEGAEIDKELASGELETTCHMAEGRLQSCAVPAGRWNLVLEAPDLAPQYLWGVAVEAGAVADLGTVRLRRGATILGWVSTTEGALNRQTASVELRARVAGDAGTRSRAEVEQTTRTAEVDEGGHFQFAGVLPGVYEIVAQQPGFSPAERSPVTVEQAAGWVELDGVLLLEPLIRLTVRITPPTEPFGEGWTVQLYRPEGHQRLSRLATGRADGSGSWTSPALPTGRYEIQVQDEQENTFVWQETDVHPGLETLFLDLPLIYVEGRVTLGEDPIEARLWFGGRGGGERIEVESDEEGGFLVVLPREGRWLVEAFADSPPVRSRGLEVNVEPVADLRTADVAIELPDTRVIGEVVDSSGLPLSESVELRMVPMSADLAPRHFLGARTDPLGQFEIAAVPPGVYSVEATSSWGSADPVTVDVAEGTEVRVRLSLQRRRTMVGRVVSETGPIPQALVMAHPFASGGHVTGFDTPVTRTEMDGRFRMRVPASATAVRLAVLAPGHAFAALTVSEGDDVEVVLGRPGGTLELAAPEEPDGRLGLVMVRGEPVDLPKLETWAQMHGTRDAAGGERAFPAMPPGDYAYCRLSMEEAVLVMSGAALPSDRACTEGVLPAGGLLQLSAPS